MEKMYPSKSLMSYATYLAFALILFVLYRTAWLSDDAYISYRCLDNFIQGKGLLFNPGHRVQAFTHPLWLFLHVPFRLIFSNIYYLGIFLSTGVSILGIALLLFTTPSKESRIYFLLLLISSAAFIDYSSSGLENPLTHLLLLSICLLSLKKEDNNRRSFLIFFLSGLLLLNRMDSILLVLPILFVHLREKRSWKTLLLLIAGMSPFIFWEIFALIYYGFPFPMTAYAKLNTSLSRSELIVQGLYYFQDLCKHDPLTAFTILAGLSLAFIQKHEKLIPIALGIALYLFYILYIGGDFMRGRFFTAPFLLALLILGKGLALNWQRRLIPIALFLAVLGNSSPILSNRDFGGKVNNLEPRTFHGILDEREFYFQQTGWIAIQPEKGPKGQKVAEGKRLKNHPGKYFLAGNLGLLSYYAGPEKHILDQYALSDPFLAQLPNVYEQNWRPGHNRRILPSGLLESYSQGENLLQDSSMKELYAATSLISQAPIWSWKRFTEIARMNLGRKYKNLIDPSFFRLPIGQSIQESELQDFEDEIWSLRGDAGLEIKLSNKGSLGLLELNAEMNCEFSVLFLLDEEVISSEKINSGEISDRNPQVLLPFPLEEINRVVIFPNKQTHSCNISKIKLI